MNRLLVALTLLFIMSCSKSDATIDDARKSLEFVTAVYNSSRQNINVKLPINKENPLYNSWLPK